jgi:primosomal protein N' (replication factor Y)
MSQAKPLRLKVQKAPEKSEAIVAAQLPVARVLVDSGVFHLDSPYDYLVPEKHSQSITLGSLVRVPFNSRLCTGLVVERTDVGESSALKAIDAPITTIPIISESGIALIQAAATRYAASFWDLLPEAVPARVSSVEKLFTPVINESKETAIPLLHSLNILTPGLLYPQQLVSLVSDALKAGQVLLIVPDEKEIGILYEAIRSELSIEALIISSVLDKSERYRNHLKALYQEPEIIIGTRNAIFTQLSENSTIIIFQDGDPSYAARRNPEWNVRDIALLRAKSSHLIFASFTPTLEVARLVELGWLSSHLPAISPRKIVCEESEPRFHSVIAAGLKTGSVLVTVAASGYINSFSCQKCRNHALCSCGGRLTINTRKLIVCSLCENSYSDWSCEHCGGKTQRAISRGSSRIAQELGSAHPGTSVLISSGKIRIDQLPPGSHLVIATNGSEPVGQYSAVVLLGGDSLFNRVGLHAEESARRDWFTALSMLDQDGAGYLSLSASHPVSQSLIKWSLYPQINAEIQERTAAHLPPYFRLITVEGERREVAELRKVCDELPLFKAISSITVDSEISKLVLRSAIEDSDKVSQFFYDFKRVRSLKSLPHLKIRFDPYEI